LLLSRGGFGSTTAGGRSGGHGHGGGGGDAELLLEGRQELGELEDGHVRDGVEGLVLGEGCHWAVFSWFNIGSGRDSGAPTGTASRSGEQVSQRHRLTMSRPRRGRDPSRRHSAASPTGSAF